MSLEKVSVHYLHLIFISFLGLFNKPTNPLVVVNFAYKATQADELSLAVGDIIETLEEIEDGWNRGKNTKTGEVGMYPTNFVEAKCMLSYYLI